MVNTPVLFIPFARPEYAFKTFEAIKNARPKKLYFYSDKARENMSDDIIRNNQIRALVNDIDWNCDLKTFFREKHADNIYTALWDAFDWIFDNEEQAIILEEDCVPSLAFFDFCDQLLPKYKNDQRIWVISGNNFIEDYNPNKYDYFYSFFPYLWGWASWRDRWQKVSRDRIPFETIKEYRLFDQIYVDKAASKQAMKFTEKIVNTPTWDYRFTISMKCHGGLGIIPKINLVSNIGIYGTHNSGNHSFFHNRTIPVFDKYVIKNPPPFVVADYGYSRQWYDSFYLKRKRPLFRLKAMVIKFFRK